MLRCRSVSLPSSSFSSLLLKWRGLSAPAPPPPGHRRFHFHSAALPARVRLLVPSVLSPASSSPSSFSILRPSGPLHATCCSSSRAPAAKSNEKDSNWLLRDNNLTFRSLFVCSFCSSSSSALLYSSSFAPCSSNKATTATAGRLERKTAAAAVVHTSAVRKLSSVSFLSSSYCGNSGSGSNSKQAVAARDPARPAAAATPVSPGAAGDRPPGAQTPAAHSAAAPQCGEEREDGEKEEEGGTAYVSLGSNIPWGRRLASIEWALQQLQRRVGKIVSTSCLYESVPAFESATTGAVAADATHPLHLNAVVKIRTRIKNPLLLMRELKQLERESHRYFFQEAPASSFFTSPSSHLCPSSPSVSSSASTRHHSPAVSVAFPGTTAPAPAATAAATGHLPVAGDGATAGKQDTCVFFGRFEATHQEHQQDRDDQLQEKKKNEELQERPERQKQQEREEQQGWQEVPGRGAVGKACNHRVLRHKVSSSSSLVQPRSLDLDLLFFDTPAPVVINTHAVSEEAAGSDSWEGSKRQTSSADAGLSLQQLELQANCQETASSPGVACEGAAEASAAPTAVRAAHAAAAAQGAAATAAAVSQRVGDGRGVVLKEERYGGTGTGDAVADVGERTAREKGEQNLDLVLPHPRIAHRNFVLFPLCDIDPAYVHPVAGVSVKTLLKRNLERRRKKLEEAQREQELARRSGEPQPRVKGETPQQQEKDGGMRHQQQELGKVQGKQQKGSEEARDRGNAAPLRCIRGQQQQQETKKERDFCTLDGTLAIPRRCLAFGEQVLWSIGGVAGVADTLRYIREALQQLQFDPHVRQLTTQQQEHQVRTQQQQGKQQQKTKLQQPEEVQASPAFPSLPPLPHLPAVAPEAQQRGEEQQHQEAAGQGRQEWKRGPGGCVGEGNGAGQLHVRAWQNELQKLLERLEKEPRLRLMGILNVSPDSFSDKHQAGEATAAATRLVEEGADILDIGGEATNPFRSQKEVEEAEELQRVLPAVCCIRSSSDVAAAAAAAGRPLLLSVDTMKKSVAEACLRAGVVCVNDQTGEDRPHKGSDPLEAATEKLPQPAAVVLMHKRGDSNTYDQYLQYDDVVTHVGTWLAEKTKQLQQQGLPRWRIIVDVGLGFAKGPPQHFELLRGLPAVQQLLPAGVPQLVGHSRKRFIGYALGEASPFSQQQQGEKRKQQHPDEQRQQEGQRQQDEQRHQEREQEQQQTPVKQRPTAAMLERRRWGGEAIVAWCAMHAAGSVVAVRTHDVQESRWARDVMEKILSAGRNKCDAVSPLSPDMKAYYVDWQ